MTKIYQIEIPDGYNLTTPEQPNPLFLEATVIADTESFIGWLHKSIKVTPVVVTPPPNPDPVPPPPPAPVGYECVFSKVNRRATPSKTGTDVGDVFRGDVVYVVQILPKGTDNISWAKTTEGDYVAMGEGTTVYFVKSTRAG